MAEKKSFLETMSESAKPESFAEEKFIKMKSGWQPQKIITVSLAAVVLIAVAIAVIYFTGRVTVPSLVGKTLVEATDWAQKNKITLYAKNVYNFEKDADIILSQDIASGGYVRANTTITIEVSLGADPEEVIAFPDIKSMTNSEIEKLISDNKLTGARITTANSDVVLVNKVISYTFTDGSEDNFKRKNRVVINVSLGSQTQSDTVVVTDFSAMKAGAVLQWGADNGITITLQDTFDNYIMSGSVVSQSVKADTEILKTVGITVTISQGKAVTVPDFTTMTKDEANTWAKANNITLSFLDKYSDTRATGKLFNQNTASGKSIKEGDVIKIDCSTGRIDITSFIGKTKIDVLKWQNDVNAKYGNIKVTFLEDYGEKGSAGKIIGQSTKNDYIATGSTLEVTLSKGMQIAMPDFAGKTEAECNMLANSAGLSVLYDYQSGSSIPKGYVISQSIARNSIITDAVPVTIVISLATS